MNAFARMISAPVPAPLMLTAGWIIVGVAAVGTGVLGLIVGDFARQWQPVPEDVPGRTALAYLTASLFLVLGTGLLIGRRRFYFAAGLFALNFILMLFLHGPRMAAAPLKIGHWLFFSEVLATTAGLLALTASLSSGTGFSRWGRAIGIVVFGACLPLFGISHFLYPKVTAGMVPAWMPARLFWAYFTGIGHVAAGIAILTNELARLVAAKIAVLTGMLARLGSFLLALMVTSFILLVQFPGLLNHLTSRSAWTALCMETALIGAAWIIAGCVASAGLPAEQQHSS